MSLLCIERNVSNLIISILSQASHHQLDHAMLLFGPFIMYCCYYYDYIFIIVIIIVVVIVIIVIIVIIYHYQNDLL